MEWENTPVSDNVEDRRGGWRRVQRRRGRRARPRDDPRPDRYRLCHRHRPAHADRRRRGRLRTCARQAPQSQPAAPGRRRQDEAVRPPRPRRDGGGVDGGAAGPDRRALSSRRAGALRRRDPIRLRRRPVGDGAVLLPARQEGLSRPVVLPRHADEIRRRRRLRLRLCDRPRDRPPRPGPARHSRQDGRGQSKARAAPRPTRSRSGSS